MPQIRLGLRENLPQFALLVVVNAFVGAMIGLERAILPAVAEQAFHLAARTAILSFIVVFGVTKAMVNYAAGRWSDRIGRKRVLVTGWLTAIPVPWLLMWAPSWPWILWANALLGVSQGLTWSTTVIMKIDLVGPKQRGLAMGLNECAGYVAVGLSALATGYLASRYAVRPEPFYPGVIYAAAGLLLSAVFVRETHGHARHEARAHVSIHPPTRPHRNLAIINETGFVNNLNDGMSWGLFPIVYAGAGLDLHSIGVLAAIYPAVWGIGQLATGALSDRIGRKWLIASGMWIQAGSIAMVAMVRDFPSYAVCAVLLGVGTAMVYPTLLAAVGDVAHPSSRASAIGRYRLWRDLGYAAGALLAGATADVVGVGAAIVLVAVMTFGSGAIVAARLHERRGGEEDFRTVDERVRAEAS